MTTMVVERPESQGGELRCTIRCAACNAFTWISVRESSESRAQLWHMEPALEDDYAIPMTWDQVNIVSPRAEVARAELTHDGCTHC
jgi:hypothetical protein